MNFRKSIIQPITILFGILFWCIIGLTIFNIYKNLTMMHDRVNIERITGISNAIKNTFDQELETVHHGMMIFDTAIKHFIHDMKYPIDKLKDIIDKQEYLKSELEFIVVIDKDRNLKYTYDEYSCMPSLKFKDLLLDKGKSEQHFIKLVDQHLMIFGQQRTIIDGEEYILVIAFESDVHTLIFDIGPGSHFRVTDSDGGIILQDPNFVQYTDTNTGYFSHVVKEVEVYGQGVYFELFCQQNLLQVFGYGNLIFTLGIIILISIGYFLLYLYLYKTIFNPLRLIKKDLVVSIKQISEDQKVTLPSISKDTSEIDYLIASFTFFNQRIKEQMKDIDDHRNRLNRVINSVNVGIVEIDADEYIILDINKHALDILGLEYDECVGQHCYEFLGDENQKLISAEQHFSDDDNIPYTFEGIMVNERRKVTIPVLKSIIGLDGENEHTLLVTFVSIAELKAKEEELSRALNRADRATMGKTILLGNVSHDIGNILTALKGNAEILQRSDLTPEQQELVHVIIDSSISIANSVDLMRERTLLETGQSKLNLQPMNLSDMLVRLYRSAQIKCSDKMISFMYDGLVSEDSATLDLFVKVDSGKLQAVISNLIDNAIKFTSTGYIKSSVQIVSETDVTYTVKFKIKDTGIGISKDSIDTIFNIYEQANENIQSTYGGTGIGLSICQHYVNMMGGKMHVDSVIEEGSEFSFNLILDKCSPDHFITDTETDFDRNTDKLKILVAEDSNAIQMVINDKLSQLNCDATIVSNGKDAVNLIQNQYFDILFLDIRMPVMSGMEAVKIIRDDKFCLPIVALTANSSETDIESYMEAGFDDHVPKPVSDENLNTILMKYKTRQLVDLAYVERNYKTAEFFLQIIDSTKDEFKMNLEMLKLFSEDENFSNLHHYVKSAHAIKSIASQVGMESVRHIAHILETKFSSGVNFQHVKDISELVSLLQVQFQKSLEYYDEYNKTKSIDS